ncbi:MAG: hypothetical protein ABI040_00545 [Rhodoferax sp.]
MSAVQRLLAGSLVIILLWVYYSAQIFLIGAEFTWVYTNALGSRKRRNEAMRPQAQGSAMS